MLILRIWNSQIHCMRMYLWSGEPAEEISYSLSMGCQLNHLSQIRALSHACTDSWQPRTEEGDLKRSVTCSNSNLTFEKCWSFHLPFVLFDNRVQKQKPELLLLESVKPTKWVENLKTGHTALKTNQRWQHILRKDDPYQRESRWTPQTSVLSFLHYNPLRS